MIEFQLDGAPVGAIDHGATTLLDALREQLACRTPKDGCSPQGQCGCCTVWVDGHARVACVTPLRRVAGRRVTTVEGLAPEVADRFAAAFAAVGASQCGFCTPGIVLRLAALADRPVPADEAQIRTALLAHLCRCTGWQSIVDAALTALGTGPVGDPVRDPAASAARAAIEGGTPQVSGPDVVLGGGGFADDTAPRDALVAVPDGEGDVAPDLAAARHRSGKVQGRRSTVPLVYPVAVPDGDWALTLQTTWTEPAYLEPDASWSGPGGPAASPLANGGAFGGKRRSPVDGTARRLADRHGRPVRVVWSREDVVRWGPKRPPVAAGVGQDGTGVLRFARTVGGHDLGPAVAAARQSDAGLVVEEVEVPGPPTSPDGRGVGWVEAAVLGAGLTARRQGDVGPGHPVEVTGPSGGRARVTVAADDRVTVEVWAGELLDPVTLRSYCLGAVHQALGWVWQEGIAVDGDGQVQDLTIRSFGILSARDMPPVEVELHPTAGPACNGSDAVFAATAAAAWIAEGLPARWPTRRGRRPG